MSTYAYRQAAGIRQALLDRRELALIDVREEADFATAHPLFAVNLPLSKLELEVRRRIPRFTTPLTVWPQTTPIENRATPSGADARPWLSTKNAPAAPPTA